MYNTESEAATRVAEWMASIPQGRLPSRSKLENMKSLQEEAPEGDYGFACAGDYFAAALHYRWLLSVKELEKEEAKGDPALRAADARWRIADFARICERDGDTNKRSAWELLTKVQGHLIALTSQLAALDNDMPEENAPGEGNPQEGTAQEGTPSQEAIIMGEVVGGNTGGNPGGRQGNRQQGSSEGRGERGSLYRVK